MTLLPFDVTVPSNTPRGRTVKFTPERMEQIQNLVERGHTRDQIAEIIGCTVGSLQVTCSRAGISLRRKVDGSMLPRKTNGHREAPMVTSPALPPAPQLVVKPAKAALVLRLEANGRSREIVVPFGVDLLGELAVQAELRGVRLGELLGAALAEAVRLLKDGPEKINATNDPSPS
jgi:hypothetical protein